MSARIPAVDQHYTPAGVGALLSVSERTVWTLIAHGRATGGRDGLWPVVRIGRQTRIPARVVARFVRERTVSAS
jgi:hypothetical protein